MEKLKKDIKENRRIADSSLRIYLMNLNKLSKEVTDHEFKSTEFLKKYKQIKDILDKKTLSTRKNYLASILVALSPNGRTKYTKGYADVAKKYTEYLTVLGKEYDTKISEQKKSIKENKNWVSLKELEKVRRKYGNSIRRLGYTQKSTEYKPGKIKRHSNLIQKYLVASLYLMHPPRRNIYANMKIISHKDFENLSKKEQDKGNYLVIVSRNNKKFIFGDSKIKGIHELKVDKALNSVLNLWLNFNKTGHLLLDTRGNKMTTNGLTKFLYQTFEPTGKKISSTMLRHIYLSEKYGDDKAYKEKLKDAKDMGHSVNTQQKVYVKKK